MNIFCSFLSQLPFKLMCICADVDGEPELLWRALKEGFERELRRLTQLQAQQRDLEKLARLLARAAARGHVRGQQAPQQLMDSVLLTIGRLGEKLMVHCDANTPAGMD